ncbi:hypothetical protein L873DRAFT_1405097 [Choiromyces venosus 120613-1]|uniref:Uncharacterized protein n=1 Tax=Choiromyces venosus 120613-1 TaxID=1336337 RepID=A0A3N4JLE5_9PEZI|nr:hypothetical protein L873DRAFT_1405097 [Choiromyces venosus 120613-1]
MGDRKGSLDWLAGGWNTTPPPHISLSPPHLRLSQPHLRLSQPLLAYHVQSLENITSIPRSFCTLGQIRVTFHNHHPHYRTHSLKNRTVLPHMQPNPNSLLPPPLLTFSSFKNKKKSHIADPNFSISYIIRLDERTREARTMTLPYLTLID